MTLIQTCRTLGYDTLAKYLDLIVPNKTFKSAGVIFVATKVEK